MGAIKVNDLKTGKYQIVETAAPPGYTIDPDQVPFTIPGADNTADVVIGSPGSPSSPTPARPTT